MIPIEVKYRDTVNRLAVTLLFFEGFFLISGGINGLVTILTDSMNAIAGDVLRELLGAVLYTAVFLIPAFLFRVVSRGKETEPLHLACKLPRETPLYLFIAMAIIFGAAYINSVMVSIFDYGTFSDEVLWTQSTTANYQVVLAVITTAVVPAFVEEFLFRGVILSNLRPFGATTAVVGSALLFGAMHQNAEQFFYATVAGLVLGYIYVKTASLWPCIIVHFVNNFMSVFRTVLIERLPVFAANLAIGVIHGMICLLGVLAAIALILRQKDRHRAILAEGCFEKEVPAHPDYMEEFIPFHRRVRLFFTVPMIIFLSVCALQAGGMLVMALLY